MKLLGNLSVSRSIKLLHGLDIIRLTEMGKSQLILGVPVLLDEVNVIVKVTKMFKTATSYWICRLDSRQQTQDSGKQIGDSRKRTTILGTPAHPGRKHTSKGPLYQKKFWLDSENSGIFVLLMMFCFDPKRIFVLSKLNCALFCG